MARIHRIGTPENDSEARAIRTLAKKLPDDYFVFHNFELTTGRGMPYEYDMAVVGDFAVYHVEVKGYRGRIRGNAKEWIFENGGVYPSPIPLANKKTKILASKLRQFSRRLDDVFVETVILLTDDRARAQLRDDQASRVINLKDAPPHLTDQQKLPVRPNNIEHLHNHICEALFGTKPSQKVKRIGLYDVLEKINQTDTRTVYLASHRYLKARPKAILKVFHFDPYAQEQDRQRQIEAIFHDQEAMSILSAHPNLIQTGDMFAWDDNKFVLPTEYLEQGRTLETLLDREEDRKLSWGMKRAIIGKAAKGLRYAHDNGIIHRDVRPLNVVVAPPSQVKLVNFDLAHITGGEQLSPPRNLKERLNKAYVAPEVWQDPASANPCSDVFSLGLLFYELITSVPAFWDIEEVIEEGRVPLDVDLLLYELSTPGSEDFMEKPLEAAAIIEQMCSFKPEDRYPSMREVIQALKMVGD